MRRRASVTVLKVVITGLLLFLFVRRTDFRAVVVALSQLSLTAIVVLALLNILGVFIAAYKWRMLLPEARFSGVAAACFASYYIALLLPGQVAQEAAKAYYLNLGKAVRLHLIAASVVVDKIISIIGLLIVGCVGLALSATKLPGTLTVLFVSSAFFATFALFLLRVSWVYGRARQFFAYLERRFPNQQRIFGGIGRVLEAWHLYLRNIPLLVGNILVAVLYQFVGVLMFYVLSLEMHLTVGFFDWSWIVGALTLALFLPLTIAGFGVREGTLIGILAIYGYGKETAIAVSLVAFSFVVMVAIIGAILSVATRPRGGAIS